MLKNKMMAALNSSGMIDASGKAPAAPGSAN
jgi:hypothetical protein